MQQTVTVRRTKIIEITAEVIVFWHLLGTVFKVVSGSSAVMVDASSLLSSLVARTHEGIECCLVQVAPPDFQSSACGFGSYTSCASRAKNHRDLNNNSEIRPWQLSSWDKVVKFIHHVLLVCNLLDHHLCNNGSMVPEFLSAGLETCRLGDINCLQHTRNILSERCK